MSNKSKESLKYQSYKRFKEMADRGIGTSKFQDEQKAKAEYERLKSQGVRMRMTKQEYVNEAKRPKIYSYETLNGYQRNSKNFIDWTRARYKGEDGRTFKQIDQLKPYIEDYLKYGMEKGWTPHTLHTRRSALCKLYQISSKDLNIELPERKSSNITRSRHDCEHDKYFDKEKYGDLEIVCNGTGARREDLMKFIKEDFKQWQGEPYMTRVPNGRDSNGKMRYIEKPVLKDGDYYLHVRQGKGGKERYIPIIPDALPTVREYFEKAKAGERVFTDIPKKMDVHSYRRNYSKVLYKLHERPLDEIPRHEKYFGRKESKGIVYDKHAMAVVTTALGHNRLNVIANNYLK
mgnify:CR=1 FL=1